MKNIHVLPTEKPSRLYQLKDDILRLDYKIDKGTTNQNIYITSDKEIKKGDWCLNEDDFDKHLLFKADSLFFDTGLEAKKIILTTDQDLIKNGVQAIDDEFLEWFVKNPSREEVDLKQLFKDDFGFWVSYLDLLQNEPLREVESKYKIIIPKEEPKQDLEKEMFDLEQELDIPSNLRWHNSKPKQETLEEAAEKFAKKFGSEIDSTRYYAFINGAKWQQEQMYSKKKVDKLLNTLLNKNMCSVAGDELIEQFKNK